MPRLTVEGFGTFLVPAGMRLVNALADECKIDQLHVCGGHAQCTTCQVCFVFGEPPTMREAERRALDDMKLLGHRGLRLSCQITCDDDMTVQIVSRLKDSGRVAAGPRPSDVIEDDPHPLPATDPPAAPGNAASQAAGQRGFVVSGGQVPVPAVSRAANAEPAIPSPARPRDPDRLPVFVIESFMAEQPPPVAPSPRATSSDRPIPPSQPVYRPTIRPPVPILTVLDDGSLDVGEEIRIRTPSFLIGRSAGDLTLPHDATISSRHAEIRRIDKRGGVQWMLHNLESVNGTFVRVQAAALLPKTIVVIGSRRYRLEGASLSASAASDARLDMADAAIQRRSSRSQPVLVDAGGRADGPRYELLTSTVTIGGPGGGCDIVIDDPLVAPRHAMLRQDAHGEWHISATKTCNGVWVNIDAVPLNAACYFQCGEQRFRFAIP